MKIKLLQQNIKKYGYLYKQVMRTDYKCIYSVALKDGHIFGYEVSKIKLYDCNKQRRKLEKLNINPNSISLGYDFKEAFPSDEEFGTRAWYFMSFETALHKYNSL